MSDRHEPAPWRCIESGGEPESGHDVHGLRPPLPEEGLVSASALNRRKFLGIAGASAAIGALAPGCIRKPQEKIVPYSRRPEDLIPGRPRFYATAAHIGGSTLGLLVESQDGRPTKIEGNPKHPMSLGATTAWAQAEVMNLYDADRSRTPLERGRPGSWDGFRAFLKGQLGELLPARGEGLALLVPETPSPTLRRLLERAIANLPGIAVFAHDATGCRNEREGLSMIGLLSARKHLDLSHADTLLALDCDFLGSEGDTVRNARMFAERRRPNDESSPMNRLYVVEAAFTPSGGIADHRLRLRSEQLATFLSALAAELSKLGMSFPGSATPGRLGAALADFGKWIPAVAADLWRSRERSVVMVGERQPATVHALAAAINAGLGNVGKTVHYFEDASSPKAGTLEQLARSIEAGRVKMLAILGCNPAFTAPPDLHVQTLLGRVPAIVHLGLHTDETAVLSTWHLPLSHFLEAWGDHESSDGTCSIQQPLIAPLFPSSSEIELLAELIGLDPAPGYELVRETWKDRTPGEDFDRQWRRWLHEGVIPQEPLPAAGSLTLDNLVRAWSHTVPAPASADDLAIEFRLDHSLLDGRYANNGWMQEAPDPVTHLTWENAASIGPETARAFGLSTGDLVEIQYSGRALRIPVFVLPGTAAMTVIVTLGYGRRLGGRLASGSGVDANVIRSWARPWFDRGARLVRLGESRPLATTQKHHDMEGRPIVLEATLEQYRAHPNFVRERMEVRDDTLSFQPSNQREGMQWGMSIDLGSCVGCNACVIACQAENNIPVVGRQRVLERREMHWLRIDRYFVGAVEEPRMVTQPMMCAHCETAPCETVCPVTATEHSPEGLNDQAYQRCIGTRYCSNNCPYKVRRFNFFQYNKDLDPLEKMQKNPDVTLRFRGVMEKCTYCVQRINEARVRAKREGHDRIADGAVQTACQQTCPTRAISFGDLNDPRSEVTRRKKNELDYGVLADLNTRPRTTYLARLRNLNPELA